MRQARLSERALAFKSATVHSCRGALIVCAILNVSSSGACLLVHSAADVPDEFRLKVDFSDVDRTCRVIWRAQRRIGVAFDNPLTDQERISLAWADQ
jgi:hypothetical protein